MNAQAHARQKPLMKSFLLLTVCLVLFTAAFNVHAADLGKVQTDLEDRLALAVKAGDADAAAKWATALAQLAAARASAPAVAVGEMMRPLRKAMPVVLDYVPVWMEQHGKFTTNQISAVRSAVVMMNDENQSFIEKALREATVRYLSKAAVATNQPTAALEKEIQKGQALQELQELLPTEQAQPTRDILNRRLEELKNWLGKDGEKARKEKKESPQDEPKKP